MTQQRTRRRQIGIQVFGETELEEHVRAGGRIMSHCISIRNDNVRMPPKDPEVFARFRSVLDLEFHDVEKREWLPPGSDHIAIPEKEHILATIRFFREAVGDSELTGFTIHCWRGVSRSAGMAAGLIYMALRDEQLTMQYLRRIRPQALPLPRILRFWDEVLGSCLAEQAQALRAEVHEAMRKRLMADLFGSEIGELEAVE